MFRHDARTFAAIDDKIEQTKMIVVVTTPHSQANGQRDDINVQHFPNALLQTFQTASKSIG
jgi:alpha/beta superfamily hydrolase